MQRKWIALILMLLPLTSYAESARFDYYLLALSVAPAFCEDEPQRKNKFAQCRNLSEPAFKAMPLTLHGLWPNSANRQHPAFCGGEARGAFCRLPEIALPGEMRKKLGQVMPAATGDCLDRYQWAKHGSCSGLAEADYFAASTALTERVNRAIGAEVSSHMGREISLDTLRNALAKADPALKDAVTFDCQMPRTPTPAKRRPMLREVRIYFERNPTTGVPGQPMAFTRAGVRQFNSGCPQGRAYIDTPLD